MRWWGEYFVRELPLLTVEALGVWRMWHARRWLAVPRVTRRGPRIGNEEVGPG